jgi:hypothetical protein
MKRYHHPPLTSAPNRTACGINLNISRNGAESGDIIEVAILKIEAERGRIGLGWVKK